MQGPRVILYIPRPVGYVTINTPTINIQAAQIRGNGDSGGITLAHTPPMSTPTVTPGQTVAVEAAEKPYDAQPATEIEPPTPTAAKGTPGGGQHDKRKWTLPSLDPNIINKFASATG